MIDDTRLEQLGEYFVRLHIGPRYRITFEEFVRRVEIGSWDAYLAE